MGNDNRLINDSNNNGFIMVIFGGTGDLTHRKLIPAIYSLRRQGVLPEAFAVAAVGRREKTDEQYRNELRQSVKKYSRIAFDEPSWERTAERIFYHRFDFTCGEGYPLLKDSLSGMDRIYNTCGNRIFYLSTAPDFFAPIAQNLSANGMADNSTSWRRLMIEKPFGRDLASARTLNGIITGIFTEDNIYRIDHYLGKEMIQSILGIRFANSVFEPIWNSRYIDSIQISLTETLGVENRGDYYEKAGALGDMVQNHILQLLALIAMEPPANSGTRALRDEKLKLLRSIEVYTPDKLKENIVLGQYGGGGPARPEIKAYREESRVLPDSVTETFAAMKLSIRNFRWAGTPFYIRTGKRLDEKSTEIVVQFKQVPDIMNVSNGAGLDPNLLIIRIQPREEILFRFNTKQPGIQGKLCAVKMNFCQNCEKCTNHGVESNSPEAYEKLIYDASVGDSSLFTGWEEVEESWKFINHIMDWKASEGAVSPNYAPGSRGPAGALELLGRDGRSWWQV